jgi:hypothetical protein
MPEQAVLANAAAAAAEEELRLLVELRDQHAAVLAAHEERAQASRTGLVQLEYERREALVAGRDAQQFRPRMASARADAADSEDAAGLVRGRLTEIEAQIARIEAGRDAVTAVAELDAAAGAGLALAGQAAAVLRGAAEAVSAAAGSVVGYRRDVAAAQERIRSAWQSAAAAALAAGRRGVPMPVLPDTALPALVPGMPDTGVGALTAAWEQAGVVASGGSQFSTATPLTVAGQLAAAGGVYDRLADREAALPAEQERARALAGHRQRELADLQARQAAGPGVVNLPRGALPSAAVSLDNGVPIRPDLVPSRPGDHPGAYMPWLDW